MKTAISIGGAGTDRKTGDFEGAVAFVVEAEKLGVHRAWSAEAWGMDAIAPLAFVAARTSKIRLGTGILQISARAPSMAAMTALSMAAISGNRFDLGLGVSGPQVVEGLHGVPFAHPFARLKEYVDILKLAFAGEKLVYEGAHYLLPRPGGEGKPLRLSQPPNPNIPIFIAGLGPKSLEFTGAAADGWIGTSFTPDGADYYFDIIRKGTAKAGRSFDDIEIDVGGTVGIGEDVEKLISIRRPSLAFQLGGMGSPKTNFYNNAYRRVGYEDTAIEVQRLWAEGKRDEAVRRVPDEMVLAANLIGTESMVRERVEKYRQAGVNTLHITAMGRSESEKLDVIGRVTEWASEARAGAAA